MNKIQQMLGAQLEVTPFTGKYSLFGKLFAHYDFYVFVGRRRELRGVNARRAPRVATTAPSPPRRRSRTPCTVTGFKVGGTPASASTASSISSWR